ncbi:MAG TPA: zinc ribbon domain-containing protein [Gemmatimonadaceae bacterium]|nr:zinc ribbon domain-containing protein [Gemmatimonadaceae bacterium]
MIALVLGTLLAVSALAFVLFPVFFGVSRRPVPTRFTPRLNEGDSAVAALREIEFDRATGKLSDTDYAELKSRYTREAIEAMRRKPVVAGAPSDEEIEEAVRAYRESHGACPVHGARPESDALFCSDCGRYLHDRCADCGAPVVEQDARYCVNCGNRLAA